jgi:hypothetical protein
MQDLSTIIGAINITLIIVLIVFIVVKSRKNNKIMEELKDEIRLGEKTDFEVQIFPWKEDVSSGMFHTRKEINIGYKYQLFVKGMPCFEPHVQIHEKLVISQLNKENVEFALNSLTKTITQLSNIHPAIKAVDDGTNIAHSLLNLIPNKK